MTTQYFDEKGNELFLPDTRTMVRIDVEEWKKIKRACYASSHVGAEDTSLQVAYKLGQQNVLEMLRDGVVIENR